MTTLKLRQRSTHVLEHAQAHHGIPLYTKDARNSTSDSARNSRARHPTRQSTCTISSTVRARSGTPTPTTIEMLHMRALPTRPKASWDSFARKRCSQNMRHLKTLGRATNLSSIKTHHIERHTGRECGASTHTCTNTLRMLTLAPPKRLPGPLCTQNVLTSYGTSESARSSWTSEQPLAHQNASYGALHRS